MASVERPPNAADRRRGGPRAAATGPGNRGTVRTDLRMADALHLSGESRGAARRAPRGPSEAERGADAEPAAPRSGAALIMYGLIRQRSELDKRVRRAVKRHRLSLDDSRHTDVRFQENGRVRIGPP